MDLDLATKVTTLALSIGALVYSFFANRRKDVDARFKAGAERMDDLDRRVSSAEQTIRTLPDKDDVHELKIEVVRMAGGLERMQATMEGNAQIMSRLETVVIRHENHLLEAKR